jgi:MFS family permease
VPSHSDERSPSRGPIRLLADPVFGPFFAGKLLATGGVWIHNIVAAILAYELSGSAFVVGLVSVAQFAPQLLLAPITGAAADRGNRTKQVVIGRFINVAGSGGLAVVLIVAGPDGLTDAWLVIASALVVGIGFVIGGPAMNALIPSLVHEDELAAAVALNSVPFTLARATGPAIGALVAVTYSPAVAFLIAAATNLIFAVILLLLPIVERHRDAASQDRRMRAGWLYMREQPTVQLLLIGVTAVGIGADPVLTLTPALSASFGAGATLVGAFASAFGVGAGAVFVVLGVLRRRIGLENSGALGLTALALGTALAGLAATPPLALAAFALAGAGMTTSLTAFSTLIQQVLPEGLRGRVMALWSMAFLGSRPLAAAINGAIADATTVRTAHLVVAVVVAMFAVWVRPSRLSPATTV